MLMSSYMMLFSLLSLLYERSHIMNLLLIFELMMLSNFFLIYTSSYYFTLSYFILFLVVSICEATLGLSLLVLLSNKHGSEYSNLLNMVKW